MHKRYGRVPVLCTIRILLVFLMTGSCSNIHGYVECLSYLIDVWEIVILVIILYTDLSTSWALRQYCSMLTCSAMIHGTLDESKIRYGSEREIGHGDDGSLVDLTRYGGQGYPIQWHPSLSYSSPAPRVGLI
ncbi:hypothetical protein BO94DRAFT_56269 [Aspergillus sclerotioniger CBS 115572]|uniref:Uncharacterized protein n=1 Tax=Aspergillus sclerotioniger CBS 115572 TaxID=1450535 RepID=A0A317WRD6_9EURO|nr:hypothetical protein BO94DRAFT_56269 [Aspergillus sclerotioniger CBS 115572]PWY87852.1 hypothetical protein BO94DRAFT_56269 [Aspergillus sclerotioniger CBS 115572]